LPMVQLTPPLLMLLCQVLRLLTFADVASALLPLRCCC
jgi:hypothetical protein